MTSTTMGPKRKYGLAWLFSKNLKKQSGPDQKAKVKDPETIDLDTTDQRISESFITMEATKIR